MKRRAGGHNDRRPARPAPAPPTPRTADQTIGGPWTFPSRPWSWGSCPGAHRVHSRLELGSSRPRAVALRVEGSRPGCLHHFVGLHRHPPHGHAAGPARLLLARLADAHSGRSGRPSATVPSRAIRTARWPCCSSLPPSRPFSSGPLLQATPFEGTRARTGPHRRDALRRRRDPVAGRSLGRPTARDGLSDVRRVAGHRHRPGPGPRARHQPLGHQHLRRALSWASTARPRPGSAS